jgi:hypothetical protein
MMVRLAARIPRGSNFGRIRMRTVIELAHASSPLRPTGAWRLAAALATALVLVAAAPIRAEEPESDASEAAAAEEFPEENLTPIFDKAFDVFPLRVMGAAQFAIGCAMLVPAWPLSWIGGGQNEVMDLLFWSPFDYTFRRPLGEF